MPAEKTTRKQVLKTGFFKHLQNTDSLTVTLRLIFINFQTDHVFEQTAPKCIIFAVSKREKCEPDGKQKRAGESRRYSCSIAADNNRAQAALHKGHLLRPREVTIDDRRQSSIKTQKQRYQSLGGRKQRCWEAQDDEAEKHTEQCWEAQDDEAEKHTET